MKLTFWGAARQVTGSMFLLELDNELNILIDCGMDLGRGKADSSVEYLGLFPFEPSMIHAVILTHAHIDHSGFIPNLIREGFEGRIICTAPTADLTELLLLDSASLNQRKLKKLQKRKRNTPIDAETKEIMKGWYMPAQVSQALDLFLTIPPNERKKLAQNVHITLIPTGHLLGAANVLLEIEENGETKSICFSGDIGRFNYPLLENPQQVPKVDYLVCETTYGNRRHQTKESPQDAVLEVIQKTCVDKSGRLIIPAFSVGRTQALLFILNQLSVEGKLPAFKIFSDSPMALQSTKIYEKYQNWLNTEAKQFALKHKRLFDFENLIYLENMKESKQVATYPEPCIIISSSGMIQGGRIEYHVKQNLSNPFATILMIGYAAEGTMGYELLHGVKVIENQRKEIEVKATIDNIDVFSGHGDLDDLIHFVKYQSPDSLKKLFLVHGEYESMVDFKATVEKEGYQNVEIPYKGQTYEL